MLSSIKRAIKSRQIGLVKTSHLISGTVGVIASKAIQDITFSALEIGEAGNGITVEYQDTETAGSESVVVTGLSIVVGIESGVSTATEVLAALLGSSDFTDIADAAISGTAGDAQVTEAETNLENGVDEVGSDDGIDRAFVEEVSNPNTGEYIIQVKEASRRDLIIESIVGVTDSTIFSVSAVDESSVTILAKDDAGSAKQAQFYLNLVHSTLSDVAY